MPFRQINSKQSADYHRGINSLLILLIRNTIHKLTNSKTELLFGEIPYRENDAMCIVANIDALKKLGWIPGFDITAGIKKTIEMDAKR